jgi:hypothetical protein
VTPIRKGTARRLGLREPMVTSAIRLAESLGFTVHPWQRHILHSLYPPRKPR